MNIEGKIAVVTGASSGFGASLAKTLVDKSTVVYGLARNVEKLHDIENKLGKNFIPVGLNITSQKEIETWIQNTFSNSRSDTSSNSLILRRMFSNDSLFVIFM